MVPILQFQHLSRQIDTAPQGVPAMNKKLTVNWHKARSKNDLAPSLERYGKYLKTIGLKANTIKLYTLLTRVYLKAVGTNNTSPIEAQKFYNDLWEKKISRSAMNNYAAAIIKYQSMIGKPVKLAFLKVNNSLPYWFEEEDITKVFDACKNIKHLAMLKCLFYGCLRPGELCNLDMPDNDPDNLTLRLRETKNGSDVIVYLNDEAARTLNHYLELRPNVKDTRSIGPPTAVDPIFVTDFGNRFKSNDVNRVFLYWKKVARVLRFGTAHTFSRHSPASILVKNGCDLRSIQSIMHHRDINTTLRYTHLSDVTQREKQLKYLTLTSV
jgi:integrase/recombinase XerD